MRILLVDDDRQYCLSIKKHLEKKSKYQISVAFDGDEAKHYLEKASYDIIFFDCDMPRLSGVDLIRIIKKENPQAALIMVSGYDGIKEDFAKIAGIDEFLRKPFPLKEIANLINKYGPKRST